jgi:hypothetical protein
MTGWKEEPETALNKTSSFVHQAKQLEENAKHTSRKQYLCIHTTHPAWKRKNFPLIIPCIQGVEKSGKQSDQVRKILTLDYIDKHHPRDAWKHVYPDGSATIATKNGETGVVDINTLHGRYAFSRILRE